LSIILKVKKDLILVMKFNNKYKTIFLDLNSDSFEIKEKINIILSPALYWVKKIKLPVSSIRDVKKLLPSIFEDTLPDGEYSYSVYKANTESEFFIFAYEDKKILKVIEEKNISILNVIGIYFAQSELSNIDSAMKIDEKQSLYVKDEIVILVPCCWLEEKGELNLDLLTLSKNKINIEQFAHIIDMKSLYKFSIALVLLIILVFTELFITLQKIQNVYDLKEVVFEKYNLKPTIFQNKSMLKKYTKIDEKQIKIREYLSYILTIKLKENEKITFINVTNKKIIVHFNGVDSKKTNHIILKFKKNTIKFNLKFKNNTMQMEILL